MEELSLNILDIAQNSVRANATRVDITVAELPAEDRLVITITDNGCGMTPEQVAHALDAVRRRIPADADPERMKMLDRIISVFADSDMVVFS